jgi:SsrA-binding protein
MNGPILNKKALFDFFLKEKIEAGISLTGAEVKSVRSGSVSLTDSFVRLSGGEAILMNVYIAPYKLAIDPSYDPKRDRPLLLNRSEIDHLTGQVASRNLTIVPTKMYTKANLVKVEIALAVPKKKADKRETLKRKALERETESYLRADKLKSQKDNP